MLNIDQIETQLGTIYAQRRTLNRAAAALNLARAVAHLREQFPTAAYAWADIAPAAQHVDGPYAADILRVHTATGEVLWNAEDVDVEEIESPATDALVYAARASESSIPAHPGAHPVAGRTPATESGNDPALLVFSEIDKDAQEAAGSTEVTTAVVPQLNNKRPTLVLFPVPFLATYNREPLDFDEADKVKLGPPTVITPEEFPTAPNTWTFFGHWENDEIVIEWEEAGEVPDTREDNGQWPEGLWSASGEGATIEEAEANVRAEYED